jgi:hypothetical protein
VISTPTPSGIVASPDGNLWFTDNGGAVGQARLDTKLAIAVQPPNPATTGVAFPITANVVYTDSASGAVDQAFNGNVTATLVGGGTLAGTATVAAVNGVATFPGLSVSPAGTYSLSLSATGVSTGATGSFNVIDLVNQVLLGISTPTGILNPGTPFTVTVTATKGGVLDQAYNGNVTLQLNGPAGSTLGGPTTIAAVGGVATFAGLSINIPGNYSLTATGVGAAGSATSSPFTVVTPAPPSPRVTLVTVLFTQKKNKKGRSIGPKTLQGYQFTFDLPMSSIIANANDYLVKANQKVKVRVGKRTKTVIQPVSTPFSVNFVPSTNSLQILTGKQKFALGGQITLIGANITSTQGGFLNNGANGVYNIAPKGFGIG